MGGGESSPPLGMPEGLDEIYGRCLGCGEKLCKMVNTNRCPRCDERLPWSIRRLRTDLSVRYRGFDLKFLRAPAGELRIEVRGHGIDGAIVGVSLGCANVQLGEHLYADISPEAGSIFVRNGETKGYVTPGGWEGMR